MRATPHQVTLLSGVCSLGVIALMACLHPSVGLGIVVALGLLLGFALDSADGQLARLTRTSSPAGEWLDHVIDCAVKLALHSAVLVAWYRRDQPALMLLIPLGFQFVAVLIFFGGTLVPKLQKSVGERPPGAVGRRTSSVLLLAVDHGVVCSSFLLWGWQDGFATVYSVLFAMQTVFLAAFFRIWFTSLH